MAISESGGVIISVITQPLLMGANDTHFPTKAGLFEQRLPPKQLSHACENFVAVVVASNEIPDFV
jgi:hypothetical protein